MRTHMKKIFILLSILSLFSSTFALAQDAANPNAANPNANAINQEIVTTELKETQNNQASSDESTVVFLRSSFTGSMIKASIYEITNGETVFIGILKNKKRIDYKTTAGKHTFMVVAESADFMEAEIIGGKTYYSIITPRMGMWKARFSMLPIRSDGSTKFNTGSKDFNKWIKKNQVVSLSEKSIAWYQKHKDNVEKKRKKYWKKWQKKSADDILSRTLKPNDGL